MKSVSMKKVDNINGILAQLGEHLPYKQRVIGSSPIGPIIKENDSFEWFLWRDSSVGQSTRFIPVVSRVRISFPLLNGILAQLGEHLPYKQRVIGSSPIGPIFIQIVYGGIAQLARAHGSYPWCQEFESLSRYAMRHLADFVPGVFPFQIICWQNLVFFLILKKMMGSG